MTDSEWLLICLIVAAIAIVAILLHSYPIGEAINGTYAMFVGGP